MTEGYDTERHDTEVYDTERFAALDDPYPAYAALRARGPALPAGLGTWAVPRYADVARLLRDPRLSHEFPDAVYRLSGEPDALTDFFRATVLNRDPPSHAPLRRAMAQMLSPRSIAALRPRIDDVVAQLFTVIAGRGQADLVNDLAYPLPVIVASELLGIPLEDRDTIRTHAVALGRTFGAGLQATRDRARAVDAVLWLRCYVSALIDRDDGAGLAEVASACAHAGLPAEQIVDNIIFLFFAGFDTTTNLIANGCAALLAQPELREKLQADPAIVTSAVEEFLRYDAPIQATARIARTPVQIGDRLIRKHRLVLLLLGSANHDERQFSDPERIDLTRTPNPHLSFSSGVHHCLGATLARIEGAAVFAHLVKCHADLEPAGPAVRRRHLTFRGYEKLPIRLRLS